MKGGNTVKCKVTVKSRPDFYIIEAGFDINSASGVEPYFSIENNFSKTIKYIEFDVYFNNRVGDPANCEIKRTNKASLKITGPLKTGEDNTYYLNPLSS